MSAADENQILSQADIDAMMADNAGMADQTPAPAPPPPATPTPAPPPPPQAAPTPAPAPPPPQAAQPAQPPPAPIAGVAAAAPQPGAGSPVRTIHLQPQDERIDETLQRIEKLEEAIAKISQSQSPNAQLQAQVNVLLKQMHTLNERVNEILQHLPNTMGYRLQEVFKCKSCGSQGLVAGRVKCTHCGQETWVGWWPKKT